MPGIIVNNGEKIAVQYLVNTAGLTDNLVLRLFENDIVPAEDTTADSLVEASFPGYAPIVLSGSDWTVAVTSATTATCVTQVFQTELELEPFPVYGYYLTREVNGDLVAIERFTPGPITFDAAHQAIRVTPVIRAANSG